jgi:hypothetical protein
VSPHRIPRVGALAVERGRDLVERHPEPTQRHDPVEPPDVRGGVQAIAGTGALRGHEQSDLVVVMERPDGQAGGLRQVSHLKLFGLVHMHRRAP